MSERRTDSQTTEDGALQAAIERLADELRVVRDVLDAIHDDLNWIVRNERWSGGRLDHSVLKGMALDPTSDDWGDRLHIVRGTSASESEGASVTEQNAPDSQSKTPTSAEPGKLF